MKAEPEFSKAFNLSVLLPQECRAEVSEFFEMPVTFHWLDQPLERFSNVSFSKQAELLEAICEAEKVDVVFFPHMERVTKLLPLLRLRNMRYSGIMFTTFNRFGFPNHNPITRVYRSTKFLIKRLLDTYRILGRRRWNHVFLLNDSAAPAWYRKLPFVSVEAFSSIVDPIDLSPLPPENLHSRSEYGLVDSKPMIACVGDLRSRKNAHTMINAISILVKQGIDVQLLIVGSGDEKYTQQLKRQITSLSLSSVVFQHRYAGDEEFRWIIGNADAVAIPYIDFFRSSGVFNHAIQSRTPVLCGNVGLIHHAVKTSGLGAGVNPRDPADVARGISRLTDNFEVSEQQVCDYIVSNNPDPRTFAKAIFEKLVGSDSISFERSAPSNNTNS